MNVTATDGADSPGGLRAVGEFLGTDPRRLDAIFHETVGLVSGGSLCGCPGRIVDRRS